MPAQEILQLGITGARELVLGKSRSVGSGTGLSPGSAVVLKPSVAPTNQPSCPFQVLVTYNGQECAGHTEQHNLLSDKVKVLLPEQGLQTCWRAQEVRPAMLQPPAHPAAGSPSSAEALQRSVSSSIDVPKRLVLLVVSCSGGKGLLESSTVLTLGLKPTERVVMLGVYPPSQHGIIQRMGKFRIKGILNCFSSK